MNTSDNPEQNTEMDELDNISTVALLIDDLSSEDPNSKLHSIQRLGQIAQLLGPDRCIEELIPMLTELIDKIDCNPELVMTLAEQLGLLIDHLGSDQQQKSKNCVHLLRPLELIVSSDDSIVRQKAIESLNKVSDLIHESALNNEYLDLVKRQKKGDLFSMRISACQLYANIYGRLNEEKRAIVRKKFTKLSNDDTPMVRRSAAKSLNKLSEGMSHEHMAEFLLPLLKGLLQDKNDSVKINAVESSPTVAEHLNDQQLVDQQIIPSFKQAVDNKQSWRLRFAVAESAALVAKFSSKEAAEEKIMQFYVTLLGDSEPEVRSEAISKIPTIAAYCSSQRLVDKILPNLKSAVVTESSIHVKGSLAHSVCALASHIERASCIAKLMPIVNILLKDQSTEVIVTLVQNLKALAEMIGPDAVNDSVIPAVVNMSSNNTWRIRLAVCEFIPQLVEYLDKKTFQEKIENLVIDFMSDPAFHIREQAVYTLIQLKDKMFGQSWLEQLVEKKLTEFSSHEKFNIRIQTLFVLKKLHGELSNHFINTKIAPMLNQLCTDKVPNIRFNTAKTYPDLKSQFNQQNISICVENMIKMQAEDTDFDSQFYAAKCIEVMRAF